MRDGLNFWLTHTIERTKGDRRRVEKDLNEIRQIIPAAATLAGRLGEGVVVLVWREG